jgi:hypothetical protein
VFESLPGVLYASSAQSKAIQYRRKVSAVQLSALKGYQSRTASRASESRLVGRCSKHCSSGQFTLASLLCLMAYRECCKQSLHDPTLQSTGVRSLLTIGVLGQAIRAKVRAGQVKADSRVGAASTAVVGILP